MIVIEEMCGPGVNVGASVGVTFTSRNWPTEPKSVVIVITNTDNLCPLKEQPNHHQLSLPHPNEHNEHEDNVNRNSTITLGDLHRDPLAHHGPSVGRAVLIKSHQNNFSPHFFYVEFNSKQLLFS